MKTICKILLASICFQCLALDILSQNIDWVVYTNTDKINCQTIQGNYVWLGTDGGIAKLNIYTGEVEYLNSGNSGIEQNNIQCLEADLNGNLWVGNLGTNFCGGLSSFKGDNWTYYDPPPNYKKYNSITADDNGNVWVSMGMSGLFLFNGSDWEVFNTANSPLPTNSIGETRVENNNAVWSIVQTTNSNNGCLAKYDGNNWFLFNTSNSNIPSNEINSIVIDEYGNKWVGTNEGLAKFDGSNWVVYNIENSGIPENNVTSVACDTANNVWVGTMNSGLAYFDGVSWIVYKDTNSMLPNNRIKSIDVDENNTTWIINDFSLNIGGGILVSFNGTEWIQHEINSSPMPNNTPTCLGLDSDSSVWVGTNSGFANIKDNVWTMYNTQNTPLEKDDIRAIACEQNGTKWFGALFYGLIKYFNQEWTVYTLDNSPLTSRQINCITIDENNNKWIGTSSGGMDEGGLIKISNDNNWTIYNSYNSSLPYNKVSSVCVDKLGAVWVGTWNGLVKIENDNWTVFDTTNSDLPDSWICSLASDSANNLWIGTRYKGLVKYDGQSWTVYNDENSGIPDNCVFDISIDENSILWLGTMYGGLTKFNGTDWENFNCTNSGMPGSYTNNVLIDNNNTKWLTATSLYSGGVALYNENGLIRTNEPVSEGEVNLISVFPNPVNNNLNVKLAKEHSQFNVVITDIAGRIVQSNSSSGNHITIDVSELPQGLYIINVIADKETIGVRKLIKS